MTREEFQAIFDQDDHGDLLMELKDCNVYVGLSIIRKYIPDAGIEGADHDIIYSIDVDKLIEAGITKEDAEYLSGINWIIEDNDYLACFV